MIAKYSKQGLIAMNEAGVDAAASLRALQGHLDEGKRVAALVAFADGKRAPDAVAAVRVRKSDTDDKGPSPADGLAEPPHPAVVQLAEYQVSRSADRARREKIDADRAEVEFMQLTGRLVDASEVAREIENSVTIFWQELQRRERDEADLLAAQLSLDQLQARRLRDAIRLRNIGLRNDYAETMKKLASEMRPPAGGQDAAAR